MQKSRVSAISLQLQSNMKKPISAARLVYIASVMKEGGAERRNASAMYRNVSLASLLLFVLF